ncbi:MAG: SDR family oxidoreductase [Propionibacterium sp.]|nr:SDR family oxidoreductase [Propionibacterium sp.]
MTEAGRTGEVAVIVGASGALGRAVTERISAALPVIAVGRGADALTALAGDLPNVEPCVADISADEAVDTISAAVGDRTVRLALFSGGLAVTGSVDDIRPSALAEAANVKVAGPVRLLQAVRNRFGEGARFIAIGGSLGFEPGPMDAGPGTVNSALANLMRQVARLYGPRGVVTATIAPGPLDTPRLHAMARRRAEEAGRSYDEVYAEYVAKTSLGRLPTVDEVAWLVEMMLAPQSAALHGSVLYPDGGVRHGIG